MLMSDVVMKNGIQTILCPSLIRGRNPFKYSKAMHMKAFGCYFKRKTSFGAARPGLGQGRGGGGGGEPPVPGKGRQNCTQTYFFISFIYFANSGRTSRARGRRGGAAGGQEAGEGPERRKPGRVGEAREARRGSRISQFNQTKGAPITEK